MFFAYGGDKGDCVRWAASTFRKTPVEYSVIQSDAYGGDEYWGIKVRKEDQQIVYRHCTAMAELPDEIEYEESDFRVKPHKRKLNI